MTLGLMGMGTSEILIVLFLLILLPVLNSVIFYRLGKKAGYDKGRADALETIHTKSETSTKR
jgi:hypothetical protein